MIELPASPAVPAPERSLPIPVEPWRALGALRDRLRAFGSRIAAQATTAEGAILVVALVFGALLRVWQINKLGLNSDEAVYAGQAAAIAHDQSLEPFFSAFRAHPLLFQTALSFAFHLPGSIDVWGRLLSVAIGLANVFLTYRLGSLLYSRRTGAFAALFLALMPYHVLVTRQILLDGPMTLFTTAALYMLARYAASGSSALFCASGAMLGLAVLSKETSIVMLGAVYAFLALTPEIRLQVRDVVRSLAAFGTVIAAFPLALYISGRSSTGGNYLAWQLFRRPNHDWSFYPSNVPEVLGYLLLAAAIAGLFLLRRERSWRETLLLSWAAVPVIFFQVWPVKGFQYLLPIAPVVAILAARTLTGWVPARLPSPFAGASRRWFSPVVAGVIALSLVVASLGRIQPPEGGALLAGAGGVPGGREAGEWIKHHVPKGAKVMTIGPSMANLVQFYGQRKAYGLSVSPNPLHRNPSYEPLHNPDSLIRSNELQYVVWDSFSAERSPFFARSVRRYADRYNGRTVHTETVTVKSSEGRAVKRPLITVYEVRPS